MITESQVMEAYRRKLGLEQRRMLIEQKREETPEEAEERIDAVADHAVLELQYVAQFA